MSASRQAFILANTALATAPACPEIRLHLATEITPLWQATEAYLEQSNVAPPYWAFPWVGGQALARHILDNPDLVRGRTVLDFAAGSGLAGIAAALVGAERVVAAEIDAVASTAVGLNAAANGVAIEAMTGDVLQSDDFPWSVILAGDVCYEKPMAEKVFAWLRRAAGQGALVLLADPGRAYLPTDGLRRLAVYGIECSKEIEDRTRRDTVVYRIEGGEDAR